MTKKKHLLAIREGQAFKFQDTGSNHKAWVYPSILQWTQALELQSQWEQIYLGFPGINLATKKFTIFKIEVLISRPNRPVKIEIPLKATAQAIT